VKVVNGFNKLIRVKMELMEKNDGSADVGEKEIKFISMTEFYRQGKQSPSQKTYNFTEEDLPEVFEHILRMKKENDDDAHIFIRGYHYNGEETVDALMGEFMKEKEKCQGNRFDFIISLELRPTKETVSYNMSVYMKTE
jgi:hypothetical protein